MPPINWYSVRHYLKWTLVVVTLLFFGVTILQLLLVRQAYIRRYVEMHLQESGEAKNSSPPSSSSSIDGGKHVFSVDEEIDFNRRFNLTSGEANGTDFAVNAEQKGNAPPKKEFSSEVKLLTGIIVASILLIELLYCLLYLYVVARKRFCSMFVFALLSLCSLVFHIQLYLTVEEDYDGDKKEIVERTPRMQDAESLEAESLLNHITRSSLMEVVLSVLETVLSLAYSAVLYKFPGRETLQSRYRLGFFRLGGNNRRNNVDNHQHVFPHPLPNGHAVSMEMQSIDGDDNDERGDNHHLPNQPDTSSQSSSSSSVDPADDVNRLHQRPPASLVSPSTTVTTSDLQSPVVIDDNQPSVSTSH